MINEEQKAKKLLLTIKYRYDINPNIVDAHFQSGKVPASTEKQIRELIIGKEGSRKWRSASPSTSIRSITSASSEVRKMIKNGKLTKKKELIKKGWIYKRLPANISKYYSKEQRKMKR